MPKPPPVPMSVIAAPVVAAILVDSLLDFFLATGRLNRQDTAAIFAIALTNAEREVGSLDPALASSVIDTLIRAGARFGVAPSQQ